MFFACCRSVECVDAFTNCVILDCMDSLIEMSDLIVKNIFYLQPSFAHKYPQKSRHFTAIGVSIYLSPAGYYYFKWVHSRSQYFIKLSVSKVNLPQSNFGMNVCVVIEYDE